MNGKRLAFPRRTISRLSSISSAWSKAKITSSYLGEASPGGTARTFHSPVSPHLPFCCLRFKLSFGLSVTTYENHAYLLGNMCASDPELVGRHIEEPWLLITDNLRAMARNGSECSSQYRKRLAAWRQFGKQCGVNEQSLRRQVAKLQKAKMGILLGCSWLRCPLNGVEESIPVRGFMTCSQCYTVGCSSLCLAAAAHICPGTILQLILSTIVRRFF